MTAYAFMILIKGNPISASCFISYTIFKGTVCYFFLLEGVFLQQIKAYFKNIMAECGFMGVVVLMRHGLLQKSG